MLGLVFSKSPDNGYLDSVWVPFFRRRGLKLRPNRLHIWQLAGTITPPALPVCQLARLGQGELQTTSACIYLVPPDVGVAEFELIDDPHAIGDLGDHERPVPQGSPGRVRQL